MKNRMRLPYLLFAVLLASTAASVVHADSCEKSQEPTIVVELPVAPEYIEFALDGTMHDDSIEIPDGRPIYALFVHGYSQNRDFDQLLCYDFAKQLMADGAYVHFAWWNNLCKEYMAGPLHQDDADPGNYPLLAFADPDLGDKATPADDFQFQADAERFLVAIREHNPSAMIILLGHSMGGGAVARLATNTEVVIDILAPIDPVGNRSRPQGLIPNMIAVAVPPFEPPYPPNVFPDYNYTRWRIAREEFLGYKQNTCIEVGDIGCLECGGYGDIWYGYYDVPVPHSRDHDCGETEFILPSHYPYVHQPDQRTFGINVINLHHRYQKEFTFPFDYDSDEWFGHDVPPGGSSTQAYVETCDYGEDPGGYQGTCWDMDGHGEIVGYRGNPPSGSIESQPLGLEAQHWPTGDLDTDICRRRRALIEMPNADYFNDWIHRPVNPDLCLVSEGLINLYLTMNRPPVARAGGNRTVVRTSSGVTLDGSASFDPDHDDLSYTWRGAAWVREGRVVTVELGVGTHEIALTVKDPSGHLARDVVDVTVVEGATQAVTRMIGVRPNPFNSGTRVVFELAERQRVSLQVFDLRGHRVRTLENGILEPGRHELDWDGLDDAGMAASSGTYFLRMRTGGRVELTKVSLMK